MIFLIFCYVEVMGEEIDLVFVFSEFIVIELSNIKAGRDFGDVV